MAAEKLDVDLDRVRGDLLALQEKICTALEAEDGEGTFQRDEIPRPGGGRSPTCGSTSGWALISGLWS